jgi:beta-lactamase class A
VGALVAAIPGRAAVFAQRVSASQPAIAIAPTAVFAAASVIKLAIMVTAYQAVDRGDVRLDSPAPFDANDIVAGSATFATARPRATATIGALLRAMIQRSDNTAANALIDRFGFANINRVVARAGLKKTRLRRYFLHFSKAHENETDAVDVGTLLLAIARGARSESTGPASARSCRAMVDTLLGQEDREKIARGLPPGVPLADKTGELPGVRHDAGIVDPYGPRPYVLVVLEGDLRDQAAGVTGINRISRAVYRMLGSG